jgi:16S rRNA (guanine527-N7)-methyltransferase
MNGLADVVGRPVSRETLDQLDAYAALLREENDRQNLISRSTLETLWYRHIVDSAQLLRFEPGQLSTWADIGSGAGLPGLVIAALTQGHVTLIEPRRLRAEFLQRAADTLGLSERVTVLCAKAERIDGKFDVITARAVAPLARLLDISHHLSTTKTRWVLPKGRSAESELAEALRTWHGEFHVEQSVTDADSWIIVGTGVRAKRR